jgi:7-cyano-7-deazaguanine synthase
MFNLKLGDVIMKSPYEVKAGPITEIFNLICTELKQIGFDLRNENTWQTIQFYLRDEDYCRFSKNPGAKSPIIGSVQYCGSNDFEKKLPNYINWRFYRNNLPNKQWLEVIEEIKDSPYRKDRINGPEIDPSCISIGFSFFNYDSNIEEFIKTVAQKLTKLMQESKKAIVILSGGLDSTVCMSVADRENYDIYPITFSYGQRHSREVEQAKKVAEYYGCKKHLVLDIGFFKEIGASALTSEDFEVPTERNLDFMAGEVPITYVPFRNAVFLSMAVGYAEAIGAEKVYIGVNALDYSGYPDCRPEFIHAFQEAVTLGAAAPVKGSPIKIETPLISLSKGDIVRLGIKNKAPLHLTTSCYKGGEKACGLCDSCILRLKGFREAGVKDPIMYQE